MVTTTISLDRILQLRVPVAWHESVAMAQLAAHKALETGIRVGVDNCLLSREGTVEINGVSPNPLEGDPLFGLLTLTLDRARAPVELCALVANFEKQSNPSSERFEIDLSFFARPDPAPEISALASRAIAMDLDASAQIVLDRVRAEATQAPPPGAAETPRSRRAKRGVVVALAAVVLALIAALGLSLSKGQWTPTSTASAAQAFQTLTTRLDALVDAGLKSAGMTGSVEPVAKAPAVVVPSRSAAPRPAPRPTRLVPTKSASAVPPAPLVVPDIVEEPPGAPMVLAPSHTEGRIYGHDDPTVYPPALVRPQLPTEPAPGMNDPATKYLELEINERGTVDKVRLLPQRNSVHDRMLLSAAKAWVFRSAVKDGRPVKYRLRVPIIE